MIIVRGIIMKMLIKKIKVLNRFLKEPERGATAVEYAIMASLIAGVIIATVTILGTQVAGLFSTVNIP